MRASSFERDHFVTPFEVRSPEVLSRLRRVHRSPAVDVKLTSRSRSKRRWSEHWAESHRRLCGGERTQCDTMDRSKTVRVHAAQLSSRRDSNAVFSDSRWLGGPAQPSKGR